MSKRVALYPGSFDPITNGHVDLIHRGASIFDKLYVAVATNPNKDSFFTKHERVKLVKLAIEGMSNVEAVAYDGLMVDLCREIGAQVILRGIRTVTDFDYEFQIALTNRSFAPNVETVFIMPSEEYSFISSSLVKEAFFMKGDISNFVPVGVVKALMAKRKGKKQ